MPGHRILQTPFGVCNFLAVYAGIDGLCRHKLVYAGIDSMPLFLVSGITQWALKIPAIVRP